MRGRTRHDLHLAGRQHPDRRRLPATGAVGQRAKDARRGDAAHLGERRDPDAELDAVLALAPLDLLGPQADHVEHLLGLLSRGLVVAAVVGEPCNHRVGELLVLDPVLLAELHRVTTEGDGQLVHDPLDRVRRLRATRAAIGIGRRLGGEHALADEPVGGHLVDRREHEGAQDRHARRDQLQVGPHVGEQLDLEAEQRAVLLGGDRDVLDLVAAVRGRLVVLAARLGPFDRPTELAGDDQGEDLLGVDVQLGAEAAADVRCHHAQLVLRDAGGQREHDPQHVRDLGGGVHRELVRGRDRGDHDTAGLHRGRDQPLLQEPALDDHAVVTGGGDRLVVVRARTREVEQEALVGALVAVHQGRALLEGLLHVDHGGQLVVLDHDRLERVRGGVAVPGDDDGHAVAGVLDLVDRQRGVHRRDHVGRDRPGAGHRGPHHVGEVAPAVGGDDAGHLQGRRHVDREDLGVRHRAAQHGHVQQARQGDVVGPVGLAGQEFGVLLATAPATQFAAGVRRGEGVGVFGDLLGDQAGIELLGHACTSVMSVESWKDPLWGASPRISAAAERTAFTMF